ncbi:MAG: Tad domain-containing protein [Nitrospiraceae bacterium]
MNKVLLEQKIGRANCRPTLTEDTRGAVAVMVAIVLVVLLSIGALALDISNAMIARNELQNVADASALAGARALGVIYQGLPAGTPYNTYVLSSPGAVVTASTGVALLNRAREVASITINPADIEIGVWNVGPRTLTVGTVGVTGVRVTARRDGGANGPVATWLAGIMGINNMSVVATATAALTGAGVLLPGTANAPFAFDQNFFTDPDFCNKPIQFYPTTTSCASFQTFDQSPSNANTMGNIIDGLADNSYSSPQITAGQTSLEFIGGNVASAFPNLINLFNAKKVTDPRAPAPYTQCWNVTVPVYSNPSNLTCGNPSGSLPIVGAATACVFNVQGPPTQQINAIVTCGAVTGGQGGGGSFGVVGAIPGLVE